MFGTRNLHVYREIRTSTQKTILVLNNSILPSCLSEGQVLKILEAIIIPAICISPHEAALCICYYCVCLTDFFSPY